MDGRIGGPGVPDLLKTSRAVSVHPEIPPCNSFPFGGLPEAFNAFTSA